MQSTQTFRVWHPAKKLMYTATELQDPREGNIFVTLFGTVVEVKNGQILERPDLILMRSTGQQDKNGKAIFEGDIALSFGDKKVVKWEEASNHENGFWAGYNLNSESADMYEVMGDIYQTPELLK